MTIVIGLPSCWSPKMPWAEGPAWILSSCCLRTDTEGLFIPCSLDIGMSGFSSQALFSFVQHWHHCWCWRKEASLKWPSCWSLELPIFYNAISECAPTQKQVEGLSCNAVQALECQCLRHLTDVLCSLRILHAPYPGLTDGLLFEWSISINQH